MQSGPIGLHYILTVLFARKRVVISMSLLVLATAVIGSFLMSPTYESNIKIMLRRERTEPVVSSEAEPAQPYLPAEVSETEVNSEIELLTSRPLLTKVVQVTGLNQPSKEGGVSVRDWFDRAYRQLHGQPAANADDEAVQELKNHLTITPVKKSNVIDVSYRAHDPQLAADVLNTLSRLYVDQHLQQRQAANVAAFYAEQTDALHQKLQEVETVLKQFEVDHGLTSVEQQEYLVLQKLADFQAQLDSARVEAQGTEQHISTLQGLVATQPERVTTETRTLYRQGLDSLRETLGTLELRRAELRQKYQPNTRVVRQIEEQVATLKSYLQSMEDRPAREIAVGPNELYMRMKDDLMRARTALAVQRERVKALTGVVQSYQAGLRAYRENSYKQHSLSRMRNVIEQAYLSFVKKAQEAQLSQALDQRRIVNINIAESAMPNHQPVSPNLLLNGVLGLMVGLFSSVATAFGLEYVERPVRTAELLERQLSVKVIAALPDKNS